MGETHWRLVIHGGAGSMRPGRLRRPGSGKHARVRGCEPRSMPASEILASGAARSTRSRRRCACWKRIPASTPGAAACLTASRRGRARRRDHGRTRPQRRRGRGAPHHAGADQPCAALDGRRPHVFLSGEGADVSPRQRASSRSRISWFVSAERRRQLDELLGGRRVRRSTIKYGTIGAVAVDVNGHVAAATSTGGLTAKRWGRIGDSPLIGAGTYADDRAAAVSATGSGEYFIRAVAAHQLAERVRARRPDRSSKRSTRCSPTSLRSAARAG